MLILRETLTKPICTFLMLSSLSAGPAFAQGQILVKADAVLCIVQLADAYRNQGDGITLNFETCPAAPTSEEVLESFDAKFHWIPPSTEEEGKATASEPAPYTPVLRVSLEQFECMIASLNEKELAERGDDDVAILPDACVPGEG